MIDPCIDSFDEKPLPVDVADEVFARVLDIVRYAEDSVSRGAADQLQALNRGDRGAAGEFDLAEPRNATNAVCLISGASPPRTDTVKHERHAGKVPKAGRWPLLFGHLVATGEHLDAIVIPATRLAEILLRVAQDRRPSTY
jgi:hypothetical protein